MRSPLMSMRPTPRTSTPWALSSTSRGDQFEFVSESIAQDGSTAGMENLSREKVQFADRTQTINLAFANRGDGKLYNGTGAVASFKLKAKTAGKVELPSTSWLIGPACDALEFASDGTVTMPDVPQPTVAEYGQDAFNITMTNDELTTDDGTNVEKLIQQKSYNALFDNNEGDNGFEFLWNWNANWDSEGKLPSYVKLPTTMTFAFKTPSKLDSVEVVNRNGGNGTVQKIKAVVTFEDGSTQEFAGGEYDSFRARYAFGFSAENKGKKATKVEVTPLEASGDQMLTLREVNFNYTQGVEAIEGVELGKNQTEFFEGDVTLVDAKATPESAGYPYVTVESSDPSVVSVSAVQAGDSVSYYLRANKAGKATITVASVLDPSKTASYEVEVKAGVDTSALVAALSKAAATASPSTLRIPMQLSPLRSRRLRSSSTAAKAAIARRMSQTPQSRSRRQSTASRCALSMRRFSSTRPRTARTSRWPASRVRPTTRAATPSTLSTATSGRFGTATGPWDRYAPVSECRPGPRLRSHRRYIPAAPGRRH